MSDAASTTEIEQAFYGSFSGHHDFRILASSAGLSREERETILHHSNLGGSALTAEDSSPLYAFYELDRRRRRWAFSRTVFLGLQRRGNDYLAHVLVLGQEALDLLRGDPFLLEELGLLAKEKPRDESVLPALLLKAGETEGLSQRRLGEGVKDLPPAALLRGLSLGPVALQVRDGGAGAALCRAAIASLLPDDRKRLSFCSRFTLPRSTSFLLAAYVAEDAPLAERYLAGFHPGSAELAPAGNRDPFEAWMKELGSGVDPLFGISMLERPDETLRILEVLKNWLAWVDDRVGPSPAETAGKRGLPVLAVADDARNQRLSRIGRLRVDAAIERVNQQVEAALQGAEKPFAALALAGAVVQQWDPQGKAVDRILLEEERRRGRSGAERRPLEDVTAAFVLALLSSEKARLDRIYDPSGGRGLLRGREEAAGWVFGLYSASPLACLELVTAWFTHWRLAQGRRMLAEAALILAAMPRNWNGPKVGEAVRTGIAALEGAAPPPDPDGERSDWFLGLLAEVRPRLKTLFPGTLAARLALQEGLLERLSPQDRDELIPLLATTFPQWVAERLQGDSVAEPVLSCLLRVCRDGLLGRQIGGRRWDVYREPAQWDLVAQTALQAAEMASSRRSRLMFEDLAWLLWAASRLISKVRKGGSPEANRLLVEALSRLVAACPEGIMDVTLRAAYRLVLCGWDLSFLANRRERLRFRRQARVDAVRRRSPHPGFCHGTLMRIAALDVRFGKDAG
ncbi:MAG: hypothetical protein ABUT39_30015 [Acidobacteriota bacterium]